METAEIIQIDGGQAVKLPNGIHFAGDYVSVRREGPTVILEQIESDRSQASAWPIGFFESIRIDDPNFARPVQGDMPPLAPLDS